MQRVPLFKKTSKIIIKEISIKLIIDNILGLKYNHRKI